MELEAAIEALRNATVDKTREVEQLRTDLAKASSS
eukprot:CAMPEP_0169465118 /NCGR_PEP_ID=MMETSP1042-20121227/21039_1 /TAXON_ID=464988 /ORGANISM="Hemiselmis andersenii, Strain CCMP1180" /LENGTH=34 /DNA_ID= /DNA_START= /DNA_END= /DNA_ORIENTATION=